MVFCARLDQIDKNLFVQRKEIRMRADLDEKVRAKRLDNRRS